ncbi:SDR family oxidoreductase [uncultured Roseobacter sp.]|uniref:dTDP-4-dehydrorhamnose reductase family protein n=1 Tax=uncultured Roseobacter sp. TaxID=114847 RepID=UPI00262C13A7|nr:SDR family oxidoreductase [uncultured Roseobacter sp.]
MKILVLGVSGMLGHVTFRKLSKDASLEVWGSARSNGMLSYFDASLHDKVLTGVDILDESRLIGLLDRLRPNVIVNCVGLIKQLENANDPLVALPINSLLPHRLARLASLVGARLIHMSTDCVFSGARGSYSEKDPSDANDLYGRSKFIGEVDYENAITLRTSIIGPELNRATGLVGWFLAQEGAIKGFTRAIFSGLPTVELAGVIHRHVLSRPDLRGVYHVAAEPISKYDLLRLVAQKYGKTIKIVPDDALSIDRSLNGERFRAQTGYTAPPWPELITRMRDFA